MKKFIAALLLVSLALSQTALTAFADDAAPQPALPSSITGTIVGEDDSANTITVKSAQTGESIVLNLGKVPRVVDCVSGQPVALKDRKDDGVVAFYGPAVTASLPPQSTALAVICNIPQDYTPPRYAKVESVSQTSADQIKVTIDNGSLIVTIDRDTPIFPYLTRNMVSIDDVGVGAELLLWYPFVASSYPGQATASQTVILSPGGAARPTVDESASDWISLAPKDMTDASANITGSLPVLNSGASDIDKSFNDKVNRISSEAQLAASENSAAGIDFSYDVIASSQYTSVVIHTSINAGDTASDQVSTFVLNTMTANDSAKYHIYTLTDLLGPNAYKLANSAIAKDINSAASGTYFTDNNEFTGLTSDPAFYVDENDVLNIIFDKYSIAPGITGTPTFGIPLSSVVNVALIPADTSSSNGVTMVPLRALAEDFGFTVSWDGAARTVTLTKGPVSRTVAIGSAAFEGGTLETAPVIQGGRTFVPLNFTETGLGACYLDDNGNITVSAIK